jgi:hypothetical protein
VGLDERPHPGVVGVLGGEVADRAAEQGRLAGAGRRLRCRVGAAEPVVVQEPPHVVVAGDQPRLVADRGADAMDRPLRLQPAQVGRVLQGVRLPERQPCLECHGAPVTSAQLV